MGMTTAIDITKEQRKALLAFLRRYLPGVPVWAYGSRVKWTARPNSDLDLIAFTSPSQSPLVSELKEAIAESSDIPFLVDVHVWDEIPERFRDIIRTEYVVLQRAEERTGGNVTRDGLFPVACEAWSWLPLAEICRRGGGDIQTGPFGSQLHAAAYVSAGVPSIRPQNISHDRVCTDGIAHLSPTDAERLSRYLLQPGDIVYSRRGDVERRALITERENGWLCGTDCLRVRFGRGVVDPQFASYFLSHPASREWVVRHAVGATMPNLNTSIFRAWFVDFEPVKAKTAGARSFLGMPQEAFDALPARFVESALGLVPEGWTVVPLDEVVEVNPTRRLAKGVLAPYLDMGQMPTDSHAPTAWAERVPFSALSKFNVAIASAPIMKAFGEAVEPLFIRSSAGVRESRRLAMLRDYLLPKLLSGEVRVTEALT